MILLSGHVVGHWQGVCFIRAVGLGSNAMHHPPLPWVIPRLRLHVCSNVSERLGSSREKLPEYDHFTSIMVVVLAYRNVGRVARTNLFEVTFRVRYWARDIKSSENSVAPLPWDDSPSFGACAPNVYIWFVFWRGKKMVSWVTSCLNLDWCWYERKGSLN